MAKSDRFLIDTQVFIWWMEDNKRLPESVFTLLNDPKIHISLSVASIWEIIIKKQKKKLKLPVDLEIGIKTSRFNILPIEIADVLQVLKLQLNHNDPFDRILIAQSQARKLILITNDPKIHNYKGNILEF